MKRALPILLLAGTAPAHASPEPEWSCRNHAVEVACRAEGCAVSETHTPMDVSVGVSEMSVCAYSGCWTGPPTAIMRTGAFVVYAGIGLPFSSAPQDRADVTVTIDSGTNVATILVAGQFAHPATCVQP